MNKVTFLEFVGGSFDTVIILEDELEVGCRTSLDKIDKYIYAITSCPLRNAEPQDTPYIPFK